MKPSNRIRFRRNPPNIAVPQGFDDLYFNETGVLIHESPEGMKQEVGAGAVTEAAVLAAIPDGGLPIEKTEGLQEALDFFPRVYNVESYGAFGDGRILTDAAITTGTATLTSATGAFTAADVGKWILVQKAGSASGDLRTTVASVTNSTTIVVAANAATTVASSGRVMLGTDSTVGIQAAITACLAAGGGKVFCPKGIYFIDGDFQAAHAEAGTNTAQIVFPSSGLAATASTIEIVGEMSANMVTDGYDTAAQFKIPLTGTIFYKTRLSTGFYDGMISSLGSSSPFGNRNYHTIIFDGIAFRNRSRSGATQVDGKGVVIDATNMALFAARNCSISSEDAPEGLVAQSSAAVRMPRLGNYCLAELRNFVVQGMGVGVQSCEHTNLFMVRIDGCDFGILSVGGHHMHHWPSVGIWRCAKPIYFSAETRVSGTIAMERWASSGLWYTLTDQDITGNVVQVRGRLEVMVGVAGGTYSAPTVNTNLTRTTMQIFDLNLGANVA